MLSLVINSLFLTYAVKLIAKKKRIQNNKVNIVSKRWDSLTYGASPYDESFCMKARYLTTHRDVCICMLDIANFTQWCANKEPIKIFATMNRLNQFINRKIALFQHIQKIELVGDSLLIVGGLYSYEAKQTVTKEMIHFARVLLSDINVIKHYIFDDPNISIRIGIHNGDVYSGYINDQNRLQLFGNAINIASRLETTCHTSCVNISKHTIDVIQDDDFLKNDMRFVQKTNRYLKGIGFFESCMYCGTDNVYTNSSNIMSLTNDYHLMKNDGNKKAINKDWIVNLLLVMIILV